MRLPSMDILSLNHNGWFLALAFFFGLLVFLWLLKLVLAKYFFWLDRRKEGEIFLLIGALFRSLSVPIFAILSLYAGSHAIEFNTDVKKWLTAAAVIAGIIQLARWGNVVITFWIDRYQKRYAPEEAERLASLRALAFIGRLVLFTLAFLLALDNIPGVKITTLIAGLGIGGIAVAIAVQSTISDLFGSLSIILDKPFLIDDFIVIDSYMGTVEHIGLKTTRIRSLSGEQLIFSNSDLLKSRIRNYKRMAERRVVFLIRIVYQTSFLKLQKIPVIIRDIIDRQENVSFDRVHFQSYGDFALIFEIVYYVLSSDYAVYMDVQQAINLQIFKRFEQEDIIFAYPTRTLHISNSEDVRMTGNSPDHKNIDTADH